MKKGKRKTEENKSNSTNTTNFAGGDLELRDSNKERRRAIRACLDIVIL